MAQFWAYKNTNRATQQRIPYLLDIQSSLLDDLQTTVVIPLHPKTLIGKAAMTKLCPEVDIEGEKFVVLTAQIAGVDRKVLGQKICDLSAYRSEIIAAIDFIISGI
jgi:toxin CcdB